MMIDATEKTKDELRFGDNGDTKPEDGGAGNFGAEQTREGPDVALLRANHLVTRGFLPTRRAARG